MALGYASAEGRCNVKQYHSASRMFNTATVRSKISYIDGEKGILRYRGYPIEQLAEKSTFLEVKHKKVQKRDLSHQSTPEIEARGHLERLLARQESPESTHWRRSLCMP